MPESAQKINARREAAREPGKRGVAYVRRTWYGCAAAGLFDGLAAVLGRRPTWRRVMPLAIIGPVAFLTGQLHAGEEPVKVRPVTGAVFGSSMPPGSPEALRMASEGYSEAEYFLSGQSNLYEYDETGVRRVAVEGVPYTTRLLVVGPLDPADFSGRVILEPAHPAVGGSGLRAFRDFIVRNGDVHVLVFAGTDLRSRAETQRRGVPADALSLMRASSSHYTAIEWPANDGIRWDVLGQTAALLRSDSPRNPLPRGASRRLYAMGWSFTGSLLRTFINEGFHEQYRQPDGSPVIDGYMIGISQHDFSSGYVRLNADLPLPAEDDPRRMPRAIDVPVIEIMSENEAVTRAGGLVPDRDDSPGARRTYEVPGTTHGDALRSGTALEAVPCPYAPSDVSFRQFAYAAMENLHAWATRGAAPPRQSMELQLVGGRTEKDELGNPRGGVRAPEIVVPLARYGESGHEACVSPVPHYLEMRRVPLGADQLAELYPGGAEEYLARYEAHLDRLIEERWILPADRQELIWKAQAAAVVAFP